MNCIDRSLIAGERVLYHTKLHWIIMSWFCVFAAAVGTMGLYLLIEAIASIGDKHSSPGGLALGGLCLIIVGALAIAAGLLRRNTTEMAVTNKRVIIKAGLVANRITELFLTKIEGVIVNQGFWGRVFGYGSIVVRGTGGTEEAFHYVARPLEFRRQIEQQIDASQGQARPVSNTVTT
jgi:uncharacterized membrane protein YdbT with pleckstrin-like domain